ncbi:MAG: SCP2 sterol-binding domain-containing protein [bacterium]|nr:SCP2 sterol-binding domain-containing protein [bacterium]
MTLAEATDKVKKLAERKSGSLKSVVNFKFEEGVIHLDDTQSPTVVSNDEKGADCTIRMKIGNFEKLMGGNLNPMMAYMSGKMKIDGDMSVAMKLSSMF